MTDNTQPTPQAQDAAFDDVELEELTEDTGAGSFGTASTAGCPSSLGTFGSH